MMSMDIIEATIRFTEALSMAKDEEDEDSEDSDAEESSIQTRKLCSLKWKSMDVEVSEIDSLEDTIYFFL